VPLIIMQLTSVALYVHQAPPCTTLIFLVIVGLGCGFRFIKLRKARCCVPFRRCLHLLVQAQVTDYSDSCSLCEMDVK